MPKTPLEGVDPGREFHTIVLGCNLQRLFSTFPDRGPGFGLLLMRLSVGITLICFGAAVPVAEEILGAAAGVFVIAGLWTPVTAALAALDQIWIALSFPSSQRDGEWIHILLGVLCVSVAMLGPGAWSIDARLFGRKRFPTRQSR